MNFIEIYDECLSEEICLKLIQEFENSKHIEGSLYSEDGSIEVNYSKKKDTELFDCRFSNNNTTSKSIWNPLCDCIQKYADQYASLEYVNVARIDDRYNFQKYSTEEDGYKVWHTEHGSSGSSTRVLAWMIYLNDAISGTEFMHFPTIKPKTGRCVIWPAGFTHVHRSEPNVGLKYLVTGWVSFV